MVRVEAKVALEYNDEKTAEAIAMAISPDNAKAPEGMTIRTVQSNTIVETTVSVKQKLATLISTIDDLLSCASTAEKAIKTARRLNRSADHQR